MWFWGSPVQIRLATPFSRCSGPPPQGTSRRLRLLGGEFSRTVTRRSTDFDGIRQLPAREPLCHGPSPAEALPATSRDAAAGLRAWCRTGCWSTSITTAVLVAMLASAASYVPATGAIRGVRRQLDRASPAGSGGAGWCSMALLQPILAYPDLALLDGRRAADRALRHPVPRGEDDPDLAAAARRPAARADRAVVLAGDPGGVHRRDRGGDLPGARSGPCTRAQEMRDKVLAARGDDVI